MTFELAAIPAYDASQGEAHDEEVHDSLPRSPAVHSIDREADISANFDRQSHQHVEEIQEQKGKERRHSVERGQHTIAQQNFRKRHIEKGAEEGSAERHREDSSEHAASIRSGEGTIERCSDSANHRHHDNQCRARVPYPQGNRPGHIGCSRACERDCQMQGWELQLQ